MLHMKDTRGWWNYGHFTDTGERLFAKLDRFKILTPTEYFELKKLIKKASHADSIVRRKSPTSNSIVPQPVKFTSKSSGIVLSFDVIDGRFRNFNAVSLTKKSSVNLNEINRTLNRFDYFGYLQ